MIQATDCPERADLGVYLLGVLSSAERGWLEAHLDGCDGCRTELAEMAGVPGMLAAVPAGAAIRLLAGSDLGSPAGRGSDEPPPEVLAAVRGFRSARRRRRAVRAAVLAVAAAALIAAGVTAGAAIGGPAQRSQASSQTGGQSYGSPAGVWQTAASQSQTPGATVMYRQMGWGTQLQAKVTGIPPGTHCQMTVLTAAGPELIAGSWITDAAVGTVWYPGSAAVRTAGIRAVVITAGSLPPVTVAADASATQVQRNFNARLRG